MSAEIEIVRHARARRMRLSVDPASGRVRLTLPPRASLKRAMAWAEEHRGWIDAQRIRLPDTRPFAPGAVIPIEGEDVVIDWDPARPRTITLLRHPGLEPGSRLSIDERRSGMPDQVRHDEVLLCGGPIEGLSRRIETWLKRRALTVLSEETASYAAKAGVTVSRVSVADPKARWGSCASTGAIRYSWRLICAPPHVRRATVAHEVAHRLHMDHSPAFYAALRDLYGADPSPARAWLKRHGAGLHWLGRG
ncbi:M48 family metallopeptidase [Sphingomonas panacisoli]|uniref:M48 family metallopeptidase n=1 Tax=Sphingomonas panacisoli TaxID=1813879 RepID=A0A5B8LDS0_9SPHN|nr:SprT family zinc-dependent metalloprotease [Sphingomonas panacisoli]QDZ06257.1 M48 family metallopeptidase [Sphingomonas panacisoli]